MKLLLPLWLWVAQEKHAYWIVFLGAFFAVSLWETFRPIHRASVSVGRRWRNHALLFGVSALIQSALIRLLPVGVAGFAQGNPFGLLNHSGLPLAAQCALTVIAMDFVQYWIHRAFHGSFPLWRVHQVHHSDPDYDVSTATRFHPLEVIPPQGVRVLAVLLLAPSPIAVLFDQLIAMLFNFTSHANASLPPRCEALLRLVFITPDLHRIHHSNDIAEQSTNFGQIFSVWDRLFGTYLAQSKRNPVITGLSESELSGAVSLGALLTSPFLTHK